MWRIPIHKRGQARAQRFALVDDADYMRLAKHVWFLDGNGYVQRQEGGRKVYLHREVLGLSDSDPLCVDHRNRDPLDNRRENLRRCTRAENNQNRDRREGTSRFRGVSWNTRLGKWEAYGAVGGNVTHLGVFEVEAEAG